MFNVLYLIKTRLNYNYVQFFGTKITLNLNISARMNSFISQILMPFKKLAIVYMYNCKV